MVLRTLICAASLRTMRRTCLTGRGPRVGPPPRIPALWRTTHAETEMVSDSDCDYFTNLPLNNRYVLFIHYVPTDNLKTISMFRFRSCHYLRTRDARRVLHACSSRCQLLISVFLSHPRPASLQWYNFGVPSAHYNFRVWPSWYSPYVI